MIIHLLLTARSSFSAHLFQKCSFPAKSKGIYYQNLFGELPSSKRTTAICCVHTQLTFLLYSCHKIARNQPMLVNVIRFYMLRACYISVHLTLASFFANQKRELNWLKLFNQIEKGSLHLWHTPPTNATQFLCYSLDIQCSAPITIKYYFCIYLYSTIHTLEILENESTFNPVSITKGIARERKEKNKQTYNNWTTRKFDD